MTRTEKEGFKGSMFVNVDNIQSGTDNVEKTLLNGALRGCTAAFTLMQYPPVAMEKTHHTEVQDAKASALPPQPMASALPPQPMAASAIPHFPVNEVYDVPNRLLDSYINTHDWMQARKNGKSNNDAFWSKQAWKRLQWQAPFSSITNVDFATGNISWFVNGKLNACENCVDRWALTKPNKVALISEGDDPASRRTVTYKELLEEVCRYANVLKCHGVQKGDRVAIYMPSCIEAVCVMLACARIGAVHVQMFPGIPPAAISRRLVDTYCKVVVTADEMVKGSAKVELKTAVDLALKTSPFVQKCLVLKTNEKAPIPWYHGRDVDLKEEVADQRPYCPVEICDSEDPLMILHTSGSTGFPKGITHTTAGYLLYAAVTHHWTFDHREQDVFFSLSSLPWISAHSYSVYGCLCNGGTSVIFSGTPNSPEGRIWKVIEDNKVTQLYMSPTKTRSLMKEDPSIIERYDLSSLRVLGNVGEPINSEVWRWYHKFVGKSRCAIVDTYWQTETGGHVMTPLPGAISTKPGSCCFPFPGVEVCLMDPNTGKAIPDEAVNVTGALCIKRSWPGMMRTIWGDHQRFVDTYLKPYPGYYYTGDSAFRDKNGYYWILGREDDILKIKGTRLGTAEVEAALQQCPIVLESACVGVRSPTGEGDDLAVFVAVKPEDMPTAESWKSFREMITSYPVNNIGKYAAPHYIVPVPALPKTRTGKIVRRIFRNMTTFTVSTVNRLRQTPLGRQKLEAVVKEAKRSFFKSDIVSMLYNEALEAQVYRICGNLDGLSDANVMSSILNSIVTACVLGM